MAGMVMRRNHRSKAGDSGGAPSLRLFRSDLLEALTVSSPRSFAVTWAVLLACVAWVGGIAFGPLPWLGLVLAGLLSWSLFEYAIHRFLFHLRPTSDLGRFFGFVMHGNHHVDPSDPARNMMPLIVSVTWMAIFCALAWLWTGPAGMVFMLGFGLGYVIYDSVHYACHQTPARGRLMRMLRRHHLQHHFARNDGNYAITAIFWDRLFGSKISKTSPKK